MQHLALHLEPDRVDWYLFPVCDGGGEDSGHGEAALHLGDARILDRLRVDPGEQLVHCG
jgi:hypothetical protein